MVRTILVTGSDTGVGKTGVVAALARLLGGGGLSVQIVKVVETGMKEGAEGDAERARRLSGVSAAALTLESFPEPLAPAAAAAAAGRSLSLEELVRGVEALPPCDWRIFEGAGGIASPLDDRGRDWADFAGAIGVDASIIVVADRLGAINQARLAGLRAAEAGLKAGIWLNAISPVSSAVAEANRSGLRETGVSLWAEQEFEAGMPKDPGRVKALLENSEERSRSGWMDRCREALAERDRKKLRRVLRVTKAGKGMLNLADNDYLDLAHDPSIAAASAAAAEREGTSASASPLITGWRESHARLVDELCAWHGFSCGLLWTSGYAANVAVLGTLVKGGDLALADRLVHNSMIAGLVKSGARLRRYPHLDLDRLEQFLKEAAPAEHPVFVVTESVFSMDGDYPDLARLAALKGRYGFCWILDEAHALGWYGPEGAGLARAAGVVRSVDVLVGTLGKTLASGGAYTLFHDEAVRDYLINHAGEFIYSTALPPGNAAAAGAALDRVRTLSVDQFGWQALSRNFRAILRAEGWKAPDGDSPVVPVRLDDEDAALSLAEALRNSGILAAAVRPPTVPAGTSRLRFSLKRTLTAADLERVTRTMGQWRAGR